jgi:hypothetical protein
MRLGSSKLFCLKIKGNNILIVKSSQKDIGTDMSLIVLSKVMETHGLEIVEFQRKRTR